MQAGDGGYNIRVAGKLTLNAVLGIRSGDDLVCIDVVSQQARTQVHWKAWCFDVDENLLVCCLRDETESQGRFFLYFAFSAFFIASEVNLGL